VKKKWIERCFEEWKYIDPKTEQHEQYSKDLKSYETTKILKLNNKNLNLISPKNEKNNVPSSIKKREPLSRRSSSTNTLSLNSLQNLEDTRLFIQKRKRDRDEIVDDQNVPQQIDLIDPNDDHPLENSKKVIFFFHFFIFLLFFFNFF
jgi:hypothetical protein